MTKLSLLLTSILFLASSLAQAKILITDDGNHTSYNVSIDGVSKTTKLEGKQLFTKVTLDGVEQNQGIVYKVGEPQVPTVRFIVKANKNSDISVSWASNKSQPTSIKGYMYPSQPSVAKSSKIAPAFVFHKQAYLAKKSLFPKFFTITDAGSDRGTPLKMVTLYPVNYNATKGRIALTDSFKVIVKNPLITKQSSDEAFLFIVGENFADSPALSKFKTFKKELGYKIRTIVINSDNNDADQIRSMVQSVYNDSSINLRYALIIGDSNDVTGRDSRIIKGTTDHYYRAIDTNDYESDINGPDIGLGRLTVHTNDKLAAVLHKVTKYQKGNFGSEEWLEKIAFIATDDRYTVAEGSHNHAIENYTKPAGYTGIFPNNPQHGGDQLYAITHRVPDETVVQAVNEGRFIVNYSGHGSTTSWAGPNVSQADVESLNHADARPFVISNACITSQFTIDESFGETWLRHPEGAITFWGSMDSSYWDEDDILEKAMYKEIYDLKGLHFDTITQYSLGKVFEYYAGGNRSDYYWETYHIFGDPSVRLRTAKTKNINITGNPAVPFGSEFALFTLENNKGAPMVGVRVAIYANNGDTEYSAVATSNADGEVKLALGDAPVGTNFKLTAYGDNTKIVNHSFVITSLKTPYLVVKGLSVDGRQSVYAQELAQLHFSAQNVGLKPTAGGTVSIISIDGPAQATVSSAAISALAPDQAMSSNVLAFKVGDAKFGDKITVNMKWILDEGIEVEFKKIFTILRAQLDITAVDFGDPAITYGMGINPGEAGHFFITVQNNGSEDITNANLRAVPGNECLTTVDGDIIIESLRVGETLRIGTPISVEVSSSCNRTELANFVLDGIYDGDIRTLRINSAGSFVIGQIINTTLTLTPNVRIPDNTSAGVTTTFTVDSELIALEELTVELDITHTYSGDLLARLISPSGVEIKLLTGSGGGVDNIHQTFVGGVDFDLAGLKGEAVNGEWKLVVIDKATGDSGTLDRFSMMIRGY